MKSVLEKTKVVFFLLSFDYLIATQGDVGGNITKFLLVGTQIFSS